MPLMSRPYPFPGALSLDTQPKSGVHVVHQKASMNGYKSHNMLLDVQEVQPVPAQEHNYPKCLQGQAPLVSDVSKPIFSVS